MTIMKYCTVIFVILNLKYVMSDDGFYYIINIQEEASENETFHLCSGATIHENLVLTSAHCMAPVLSRLEHIKVLYK